MASHVQAGVATALEVKRSVPMAVGVKAASTPGHLAQVVAGGFGQPSPPLRPGPTDFNPAQAAHAPDIGAWSALPAGSGPVVVGRGGKTRGQIGRTVAYHQGLCRLFEPMRMP